MAAAAMKILVTGPNGLIGSEAVEHFARQGHIVHGIYNNMRADFFGRGGDTSWRQIQLQAFRNFQHHAIDIRNRAAILGGCQPLEDRGQVADVLPVELAVTAQVSESA